MLRDAEEEVVVEPAAVVEHGDTRLERRDAPLRDETDATLLEGDQDRLGRVGRRRDRPGEGDDDVDLASVAHATLGQEVVEEQGALARRRRALERRAADADDRSALGERGDLRRHPLGARDRVELLVDRQPRRRRVVVVGAEGDDEHVAVVRAGVGRHRARLRVDRLDLLAHEPDARLRDRAVREPHRLGGRPPEHDVELRVAEDERVALVHQRHLDLARRLLGEGGRELQAAEPGAEDEDLHRHGTILRAD